MKYCAKCGRELANGASTCPSCGASASNGLHTAIKVLLIIGTIVAGIYGLLIPLIWCIPMTISVCNKLKNNEPISTGFKVCVLIFVNTIAGILLLTSKEN